MSSGLESKLANPDMQGAPRALLRAARRAREIAFHTNTPLVIVRDGGKAVFALDESPTIERAIGNSYARRTFAALTPRMSTAS